MNLHGRANSTTNWTKYMLPWMATPFANSNCSNDPMTHFFTNRLPWTSGCLTVVCICVLGNLQFIKTLPSSAMVDLTISVARPCCGQLAGANISNDLRGDGVSHWVNVQELIRSMRLTCETGASDPPTFF